MVTAAPQRPDTTTPDTDSQQPTIARPYLDVQAAPPAAKTRPAPISFDQFIVAQLPLVLAVALIFGLIATIASRNLPAGGAGSAAAGGGASATSATFTSDAVAQVVNVAADPSGELKWDQASYEAKAGDVTFQVANKSVITHNFAIEGNGIKVQSKDFGPNTTSNFTLKGLKAGEYTIVCNFAGHREAGMVAKLVVK